MKKLFGFFYLAIIALCVLSCEHSDDEVEPPTDNPPAIPSEKNGTVNFYLSTKPWNQDSIAAVYATFIQISFEGPKGEQYILQQELPEQYNLLDSGLFLGSNVLDTGLYSQPCIQIAAKQKHEDPKKRFEDKFNPDSKASSSYIKFGDGELEPLYVEISSTFCFEDSLKVSSGDDLSVLIEIDLENSIRVDTLNKKVKVCHVPSGNPWKAHTIEISEDAVQAHLSHGDYLGPCKKGKDEDDHDKDKDKEKKDKHLDWDWWKWDWERWKHGGESHDNDDKHAENGRIHHGDKGKGRGWKDWHDWYWGQDGNDDHKDKNEKVKIRYYFEPEISFVVPIGFIEGNFRDYRRYPEAKLMIYESGIYSDTEYENDFANAIEKALFDNRGDYNLELYPDKYDLIVINFRRGRVDDEITRENSVMVLPNQRVVINF